MPPGCSCAALHTPHVCSPEYCVLNKWKSACRGCNPVVCYDGARLTARSFADMTNATRLLLRSLTHPTRLLTLNSGTAALASGPAARRSLTLGASSTTTGAATYNAVVGCYCRMPTNTAGTALHSIRVPHQTQWVQYYRRHSKHCGTSTINLRIVTEATLIQVARYMAFLAFEN